MEATAIGRAGASEDDAAEELAPQDLLREFDGINACGESSTSLSTSPD